MDDVIVEQQNIYNLRNNCQQHDTHDQSSRLSAAHKIKRSLSHRRKLVKKLPLIKKEIEIETTAKESTERLIQSIVDCNISDLKQYLDNGADVNAKYNNWSLLHYACSMIEHSNCGTNQHLELIKMLLQYGAYINSKDDDRWTPLHLACQLGVTQVISYLVKEGADKDACTIENLRPIDLIEPDNYIAVSFLISGIDCHERTM